MKNDKQTRSELSDLLRGAIGNLYNASIVANHATAASNAANRDLSAAMHRLIIATQTVAKAVDLEFEVNGPEKGL